MIVIILLLEFLVFIVLLSVVSFYGIRFIGRIVGQRVHEIHKQTEYILNHERVPTAWIRKYPGDVTQQPDKYARWRKREKVRYFRQLKKLSRYFTSTPVFDDMASRQQVLSELERIKEYWQQTDWAEITSLAESSPDASQQEDREASCEKTSIS